MNVRILALLLISGCSGHDSPDLGMTHADEEGGETTVDATTVYTTAASTSAVSATVESMSADTTTVDSTTATPPVASDAGSTCVEISLPFASLPSVGQGTRTLDVSITDAPLVIEVEVLQSPDPDDSEQWNYVTDKEAAPEEWDRADVPEGACVLRLVDLAGRCYANSGSTLYTRADSEKGLG